MERSRLAVPVAALFALCAAASALTLPQKISFQGKLLDPSTNAPKAGPATLTLSIYNVPSGGAPLYTETQSNVPLTNGVFAVQLGTGTALFRDLFAGASAYLGVTVSGDPGGEMAPRSQLVMSPYAFTASQLSDASDVRLIAGSTYSTFTSAGNLTVPAGVTAASATVTGALTASSGTFTATGAAQYSVAASSGIAVRAGTLSLAGSAGLDAGGTGLTASTATFTATGAAQFSLTTSSGINVQGGTLLVGGSGGLVAVSSVQASTYYGSGADLDTPRPALSSATLSTTVTMVSGTEQVVLAANVTPSRTNSLIMAWSTLGLNRAVNSFSTWQLKLRRQIGGACTTASTQVGITNSVTVPNTSGTNQLTPFLKVDAPATTSAVQYCITLTCNAAQTMDERTLVLMEAQP